MPVAVPEIRVFVQALDLPNAETPVRLMTLLTCGVTARSSSCAPTSLAVTQLPLNPNVTIDAMAAMPGNRM